MHFCLSYRVFLPGGFDAHQNPGACKHDSTRHNPMCRYVEQSRNVDEPTDQDQCAGHIDSK